MADGAAVQGGGRDAHCGSHVSSVAREAKVRGYVTGRRRLAERASDASRLQQHGHGEQSNTDKRQLDAQRNTRRADGEAVPELVRGRWRRGATRKGTEVKWSTGEQSAC